jgi:signal transduction histidine kinase
VIIEEVVVDGKTMVLPPANPGRDSGREVNLEIGPGKHYVEFHYTGLSFTTPEQVRFRYRLRGLDDQWVEAGTRRFAQYTFLRPGEYHFEVVACNNEGLWNSQVGALRLRLQPYFWETWWFLLTMGVLVAGSLALGVRQVATRKLRRQMERLEQQQALERDRARIAKDIHDDLGAGLTQIGLLTELSRRAPPEALGGRLNQISETARELTGTMDEIVWAVNPQNDTLDGLAIYLCKFGQEFLSVAGIRCRLEVPVQLPSRVLTAETRHNLFLAVKETLHNIVKHARATEVWLKLVPGSASFTIIIQDNGRGFPPNGGTEGGNGRLAAGNGLPNLVKRLQSIGGCATFNSTPGQGVTVEFTAPFASPRSPSLVIATEGAAAPSSLPSSNH